MTSFVKQVHSTKKVMNLERAVHYIVLFYLISVVKNNCSTFHRCIFVLLECLQNIVNSLLFPILQKLN